MVHLYPQVPAAEKVHPVNAILRSASSIIIAALLPPNSKIVFPNLLETLSETIFPILVLPVNETKLILASSTNFYPIFPSPQTKLKTPPGKLFLSKTSIIIFVVATETKLVVSDPFQIVLFPQIIDKARFHPNTALGKLNAEITPTLPKGFQFS